MTALYLFNPLTMAISTRGSCDSRQRFGVVLVEEFDVWNDIEFRGEFRVGSAFSNVSNYTRYHSLWFWTCIIM